MIGIYGFQNLITNKWYIGQSIHIEARRQQHLSESLHRKNNNKFHNTINKYGIDNFNFVILEECSPEQLNEREIYWINYYNSFVDGYNSTPGGQEKYYNPQLIYDAWDQGLSIKQISEKLNIGTSCIYYNLQDYPKYNKHESKVRGGLSIVSNNNTIFQYDLNGNFIKEWRSYKEIEKILGYNSALIGKCVAGKRKSAYNYQWFNFYSPEVQPYNAHNSKPKAVIQYDLNGQFIQIYSSIAEASRMTQCDSSCIRKVCNKERNKAGNYKWEWA